MDRRSGTCDRQERHGREDGILSGRLDEDKIDQLRRWGSGLMQAESDELRATGRAILLLIEEIEALHVDLWHAKAVAAEAARDGDESPQQDLHRSLADRLRLSRSRTTGET